MDQRLNGYTLIELLVVVGILALVTAVATPVIGHVVRSTEIRSDAYHLMTELRSAQAEAVERQQTITFAPTTTTLTNEKGQPIALSEGTTVELDEPLYYFPDGTSSGGRLALRNGPIETDVNVAWLTGKISEGRTP